MSRESPDVLEAISTIAQARRGALAAVARSEGLGPEDAVDCVQEALCTFLDLAQDGRVPDAPADWPALLTGIVRNAARNGRRRHFRSRRHDDVQEHSLGTSELLADELLARAEQHVRLRECVEELCEIQKAVVTLRMLEELPGQDVATALGITSGHVAVLLHRAKASLRACMVPG